MKRTTIYGMIGVWDRVAPEHKVSEPCFPYYFIIGKTLIGGCIYYVNKEMDNVEI